MIADRSLLIDRPQRKGSEEIQESFISDQVRKSNARGYCANVSTLPELFLEDIHSSIT